MSSIFLSRRFNVVQKYRCLGQARIEEEIALQEFPMVSGQCLAGPLLTNGQNVFWTGKILSNEDFLGMIVEGNRRQGNRGREQGCRSVQLRMLLMRGCCSGEELGCRSVSSTDLRAVGDGQRQREADHD